MLTQHRLRQGDWLTIEHPVTTGHVTIQVRWIERHSGEAVLVVCDDRSKFVVTSNGEERPDDKPAKPRRPRGRPTKVRLRESMNKPGDRSLSSKDANLAIQDTTYEDREFLETAIDRISDPKARDYFRLIYLENWKQVDALEELGLSRHEAARLHRHASKELASLAME